VADARQGVRLAQGRQPECVAWAALAGPRVAQLSETTNGKSKHQTSDRVLVFSVRCLTLTAAKGRRPPARFGKYCSFPSILRFFDSSRV
jgi:hypothetical protein